MFINIVLLLQCWSASPCIVLSTSSHHARLRSPVPLLTFSTRLVHFIPQIISLLFPPSPLQEVEYLTNSLGQLKGAQQKFIESQRALAAMGPDSEGKESLIPMTSSLYVPGTLAHNQRVLVDVGKFLCGLSIGIHHVLIMFWYKCVRCMCMCVCVCVCVHWRCLQREASRMATNPDYGGAINERVHLYHIYVGARFLHFYLLFMLTFTSMSEQ